MIFNKIKVEMIPEITLSSKESVKKEALILAKGDVRLAKEIYDYLVSDLQDLPDRDPAPSSFFDRAKGTLDGTLGWVKENQDTIEKVYSFIRTIIGKGTPVEPASPITPIN